MSKNDNAWNRVFDQTPILNDIDQHGYAHVTASALKQLGGREPRLMAKLDTFAQTPSVFKEHHLAILPVRNGEYVIFSDPENRSYFSLATELRQLVPARYRSRVDLGAFDSYPGPEGLSESQALDFALLATILKTFTGDDDLQLTIRGRLSSGDFGFSLPQLDHWVDVSGVQIEVDAGYETAKGIYVVEAKAGKRDDFHIRQLYYPYLQWTHRSCKQVVPILFLYSNGLYWLMSFAFNERFGDVEVVKAQCYSLDETPRTPVDIRQLLDRVPQTAEAEPYPQANDMDTVVDVVWLIHRGLDSKAKLARELEFDVRQGDYYANAASYLGFVARSGSRFVLTELGERFLVAKTRQSRTELILSQLAMRPSFRAGLNELVGNQYQLERISTERLAEIITRHTHLNHTTALRRASTMRAWLDWILRNCEVKR